MQLSFLTCTHAPLLVPARALTQELLHFLRAWERSTRIGVLHLLPLLLPVVRLTQHVGWLGALCRRLKCLTRTTPTRVDSGMVGT